MKDMRVRIRENRKLSPTFYKLTFDWNRAWGEPRPGQFFEARLDTGTAPLLRRPFAFSAYDGQRGRAEAIYEIRGTVTEKLSHCTAGDPIRILGPLGNGFSPQTDKIIAVGGGIGLGPMLFSAQAFHAAEKSIRFVTGYRTAEAVPTLSLPANLNTTVCTDDGSRGFHGNVVDYLSSLPAKDLKDSTLLCCGPHPMLAALHRFCMERNIACLVSLEEMMACGIGACMGCVVDLENGEKARVCKEGPVFNSKEILWT
ncbi:MAG: dihydroorotate dehydrogenase electron transfer subunit [Fibrobacterota bacterium]